MSEEANYISPGTVDPIVVQTQLDVYNTNGALSGFLSENGQFKLRLSGEAYGIIELQPYKDDIAENSNWSKLGFTFSLTYKQEIQRLMYDCQASPEAFDLINQITMAVSPLDRTIISEENKVKIVLTWAKEVKAFLENDIPGMVEGMQELVELGAIKIANQIKERETKVAETRKDQDIAIAETKKQQEISVANADKDRISQVAIANAEKESQVAKAEAEKNIRIEQANTEKESRIAELNSDMEIKQAEAAKKAAIGRNEAQKAIAQSDAELAVTQANADKQAGEAAARSEAAVQTAREIAQKEVEEAKARKVESSLKADKIVPAEIAKQEAVLQADAVAEKITREAEARAKALLAQAQAEAQAIKMKLEAEADGKKKSLLAEAEGFEAMVKAAESNPAIAIQYKMVDQWKEIAGEQVKAFEHINLGNITVFDGGNGGTSNFLNTLVKTVAPSLGVLDKLPIGETVKGIINPEEKKEEKTEGKEK